MMTTSCSLKKLSCVIVLAIASAAAAAASGEKTSSSPPPPPHVTNPPNLWLPQSIVDTDEWKNNGGDDYLTWKPVMGCCARRVVVDEQEVESSEDETCDDPTAAGTSSSLLEPVEIGKMPQFSTKLALKVLDEAFEAWNGGFGAAWPQLSLQERYVALSNVLVELQKSSRDAIGEILMWEIGKNKDDALKEFDRTMDFARLVLETAKKEADFSGQAWKTSSSTRALVRRAALGIVLCLGPYNYPLNETYAALIPALLMGNICILKIPTVGGLVHLLTLEAFTKALPKGAIHFIAGSGRSTLPPLMATGKIDALAFIGGSDAADDLIAKHPHPHRLKVFLQLEANNMGIYLPDLFDTNNPKSTAMLDHAVDQAVVGSLSYNGQRCTALKLHMVPSGAPAETFVKKLVERVEALRVGLPWEQPSDKKYSQITPLPTPKRIEYMQSLLDDALAKGAKIQNKNGGTIVGGGNGTSSSTLMVPAVLYPVTPDMRVFYEEQFGPLVPVATYNDLEKDVLPLARDGPYGQQVAIFTTSAGSNITASLLDRFALVYGRIHLNTQCGRGPDDIPFTGRRSSAMGTMSVVDALREFSIPIVVSYNQVKADTDDTINQQNQALATDLTATAKFLQP